MVETSVPFWISTGALELLAVCETEKGSLGHVLFTSERKVHDVVGSEILFCCYWFWKRGSGGVIMLLLFSSSFFFFFFCLFSFENEHARSNSVVPLSMFIQTQSCHWAHLCKPVSPNSIVQTWSCQWVYSCKLSRVTEHTCANSCHWAYSCKLRSANKHTCAKRGRATEHIYANSCQCQHTQTGASM